MCLIIEKFRKATVSDEKLSKKDLQNLDSVKSYIADHFAFDIRADQLAKIACMSQTKLRYTFKNIWLHYYGVYSMLQNSPCGIFAPKTDFQIYQIAKAVGYSHAGRFSNLFQKDTGFLPEEYRHKIKTNH